MTIHLIILLFSFALLWYSSGFVVNQVKMLTSRLKLPTFSFSLLLLGILTSLPELSVGINAVLYHTPEISLGNLIGGQAILVLCIIPLLALSKKKGLHFHYPLQPKTIGITIATIALPFYALINQYVSVPEAIAMLLLFFFFTAIFMTDLSNEHKSLLRKTKHKKVSMTPTSLLQVVKIVVAVGIIFVAANRLVVEVTALAVTLGFHPFFVSLLVIAFGTNIPEIALALRSLVAHREDIALAGYLGSAAANTLIAAVVVIASGGVRVQMSLFVLLVPLLGLFTFWWFARSKRTLAPLESLILLGFFIVFVALSTLVELH